MCLINVVNGVEKLNSMQFGPTNESSEQNASAVTLDASDSDLNDQVLLMLCI